jgi:hypothetical protein
MADKGGEFTEGGITLSAHNCENRHTFSVKFPDQDKAI